jgi:hypothetical protein
MRIEHRIAVHKAGGLPDRPSLDITQNSITPRSEISVGSLSAQDAECQELVDSGQKAVQFAT